LAAVCSRSKPFAIDSPLEVTSHSHRGGRCVTKTSSIRERYFSILRICAPNGPFSSPKACRNQTGPLQAFGKGCLAKRPLGLDPKGECSRSGGYPSDNTAFAAFLGLAEIGHSPFQIGHSSKNQIQWVSPTCEPTSESCRSSLWHPSKAVNSGLSLSLPRAGPFSLHGVQKVNDGIPARWRLALDTKEAEAAFVMFFYRIQD
jgi:hypothetical protein